MGVAETEVPVLRRGGGTVRRGRSVRRLERVGWEGREEVGVEREGEEVEVVELGEDVPMGVTEWVLVEVEEGMELRVRRGERVDWLEVFVVVEVG